MLMVPNEFWIGYRSKTWTQNLTLWYFHICFFIFRKTKKKQKKSFPRGILSRLIWAWQTKINARKTTFIRNIAFKHHQPTTAAKKIYNGVNKIRKFNYYIKDLRPNIETIVALFLFKLFLQPLSSLYAVFFSILLSCILFY